MGVRKPAKIRRNAKKAPDRLYRVRDMELVYSVLYTLEQNDMNMSETGRVMGIAKSTVFKYHKDHWNDYLDKKKADYEEMDKQYALQVVKQKVEEPITEENAVEVLETLMTIRGKLENSFFLAVDEINRRIVNPMERQKLYTKDLIQHVSAILPYLILKKMEEKVDEATEQGASFMDNFITMMNDYKAKQQEKNENNKGKN